jgi:hypothetical protein
MDNNLKIKELPEIDLRKIIAELMAKTMVSIGQAKPDGTHFATWLSEFMEFVLSRYGNYRRGLLVTFFAQIAGGTIELDKLNSKTLIVNFKKVFFRKAEADQEPDWMIAWNHRTTTEKEWDEIGRKAFFYRKEQKQYANTCTFDTTVKQLQSGEIQFVEKNQKIEFKGKSKR